MGPRKLLFVVNVPEFFLSHRLPVALAAKKEGYEVHVATAAGSDVEKIRAHGLTHHVIPFARSGQHPLRELKTLLNLVRVFRELKPDLVHLVTIKPVLYGGMAARATRVRAVVAAVSGLGTVFIAKSPMGRLRRWLVTRMYRSAFKLPQLTVIFQNSNDRDMLLTSRVVQKVNTRMIRGSGVDLDNYPCAPEPKSKPVIVMAARLLKDKGVFEFVQAARILHGRGLDVDMRLVGSPDAGNPTSVTNEDLERWKQEGCVQLLGYRSDIAKQYAAANIVCLPSYYGEGLPKTLVEAAACGRAVITTNHPGCRDAIEPDVTGVLVPVKNAPALADAIQALIESPERRLRMGKAGRELAEKAFSIDRIVEQHLAIYTELLGDG